MSKRIIVTGGAGFIGSTLVRKLLNDNYQVLIIDDFNDFYDPSLKKKNIREYSTNKNFILKKGDITSSSFISRTFSTFKPTHIVHLAARAGVRPSLEQPELYTQVNINGTINILEACKKLPIKNFIFASSSSVYGNNNKVPFSEKDSVESPISPYALTKRTGELICEMYAHLYNIPITALRFFTVYGPRQRPDLAIRKFMTKIINGKPIEMYGNGSTSRDYTYIDDIIDGIMKALNKPSKFEIINLGNSHPISLKQLIQTIEKVTNKKAVIKLCPIQKGDVERTYADISKANEYLKWQPKTSTDEGLQQMYCWLKTVVK